MTSATRSTTIMHSEPQQFLRLGREQGWHFQVLGKAPMPVQPVHAQGWMIVPAHLDTSPLPARTMQRIQTIYARGLRPKGFVVVHEAPKLLPASAKTASHHRISTQSPLVTGTLKLLPLMAGFFLVALLAVIGAILIAALLSMVLFAGLAIGVILLFGYVLTTIDPILVAVLEDGTWVEIDRWWIS